MKLEKKVLKALILCGGKGTRIEPLSKGKPKCLMEVSGKPFIFYILQHLKSLGVLDVVLCTGYKSEMIELSVKYNYLGMRISYSRETKPLGTGGAIINAINLIENNTFIVLNGDSFCAFDFSQSDLLQEEKSFIYVHELSDVSRFGEVKFNNSGFVTGFTEKSGIKKMGFINSGIYILHRSDMERFPKDTQVSFEKEILHTLIGKLKVRLCKDGFIDIGTPESYGEAESFFASLSTSN